MSPKGAGRRPMSGGLFGLGRASLERHLSRREAVALVAEALTEQRLVLENAFLRRELAIYKPMALGLDDRRIWRVRQSKRPTRRRKKK